jgi:SNF2 family DNA or RNA helicase
VELHEIRAGMLIKGLLPGKTVTIMTVIHHGSIRVEIAYKDGSGQLGSEIIYADTAQDLEVVSDQLPWSYAADGSLFRLVSEAYRIHLAYLFDPLLAVHTSLIDPLPHQITAVYEAMLRKQPLRYLLADDPGSGKTIMTGLLIKELMIRGDLHHCLIVAPGNLVEQWRSVIA